MNYQVLVSRLLQTALASVLLSGSVQAAQPVIDVDGAWVRSLPAVSRVNSGYMTIHNRGTSDDRLISARTEMAKVVEIHLSQQLNGMVLMRPVEGGVALPAGGKLELSSGGYHLMLRQLKRSPAKGESVMVYLTFEQAGEIAVEAQVRSNAPVAAGEQVMQHSAAYDHAAAHDHGAMSH